MIPLQSDEGWQPAITGFFTLRVWRVGRSSVLARIRALWLVSLLLTPALAGLLHSLFDEHGVLARWMVWAGWASFGLCGLSVWASGRRVLAAAKALPKASLAPALPALWARAAGFAMTPVLLTLGCAQATLDTTQVIYPVYWATLVSMSMLIVLAPTVERLRRVEEARVARDGVSVIEALSTQTIKLSKLKQRVRRS